MIIPTLEIKENFEDDEDTYNWNKLDWLFILLVVSIEPSSMMVNE